MALTKSKRFDVFRRDGFTCQYCGSRPPDVVLEVDHLHPVSQGGSDDALNLVTACYGCNRGKAAKVLTENVPKPDADLAFLETQQEVAEMRRYQEALAARDALITSMVSDLQDLWAKESGLDWTPAEHVIRQFLGKYPVATVGSAVADVARKVGGGYLSDKGNMWVRYTWAVMRNMDRPEEDAVGEPSVSPEVLHGTD